MIFTKIVIANWHEKLRKLSFLFFRKIQIRKIFAKILGTSHFWNIKVALLKISNPDSLWVNKRKEQEAQIWLFDTFWAISVFWNIFEKSWKDLKSGQNWWNPVFDHSEFFNNVQEYRNCSKLARESKLLYTYFL